MDGRRRVNIGLVLIAAGAGLLLVSLFLDWFKPGLTAWTAFELVDLLLALFALGALFAVFARAVPAAGAPALPGAVVAGLSCSALVLVLVALVNHPPAAVGRPLDTGIWLALAGALLMSAGAALDSARISFTVTFSPREREAGRRGPRPDRDPAAPPAEPTEGLGYEDRPEAEPETRQLRPDDRI